MSLDNSSMFVHTASKSAWRSVLAKAPGISYQICRKRGLSNSVRRCIVPTAQSKRFRSRSFSGGWEFYWALRQCQSITISILRKVNVSQTGYAVYLCIVCYKVPPSLLCFPFSFESFLSLAITFVCCYLGTDLQCPWRKHCIHIRNIHGYIHGYIHIRVSMGTPI